MCTKRQDDALLHCCGIKIPDSTVYIRKEKLPVTLDFEQCYPQQPASEPTALQAAHCLEHAYFAAPPKPLPLLTGSLKKAQELCLTLQKNHDNFKEAK